MKSLSLDARLSSPVAEETTQGVGRSAQPLPSGWWLLCHKILRDRPAVLGLAIIGLLVCTALLAPTLPPSQRTSRLRIRPSGCWRRAGLTRSVQTPWGGTSIAGCCLGAGLL